MSRFSMTKTVYAVKLNPRTGAIMPDGWATIPYGARIDDVEVGEDETRFKYLGDVYVCATDKIKGGYEKEEGHR